MDSARAVPPAAPSIGLDPSAAGAATPPTAPAAPPVALALANLLALVAMPAGSAKPAERLSPQTVSEPDPKLDRARRKPEIAESQAPGRPPVSVWASVSALPGLPLPPLWAQEALAPR